MNFLVPLLLATTTIPATGGRPGACTPPRAGQLIQVRFSGNTDLAQMADWARTTLCIEYTFDRSLAARRLPEYARAVVDGADAAAVFEMLLHTMNLRAMGHGPTRTIAATGDDPAAVHLAELAAQIRKIDATHYQVARDIVAALLAGNGHGWFKATPEVANGKIKGMRLSSIKEGGPSARLGFANGDLVTSINGLALIDPAAAVEAYSKSRTADRVTFGVVRGGRDVTIEWALVGGPKPAGAPAPDMPDVSGQITKTDDTHYTITRAALRKLLDGEALVRSMRIVPEQRDGAVIGVRLFSIKPGSAASAVGIRNGDVILAINGLPTSNPDNVLQLYGHGATIDVVKLSIVRLGQPLAIEVKIK
jgi:type II secretory pathway component PulC